MRKSLIVISFLQLMIFVSCVSKGSSKDETNDNGDALAVEEHNQNKETGASNSDFLSRCFVDETVSNIAYLYNEPNGKIIDTLFASTDKDYYVCVDLLEFTKDFAKIEASYVFCNPDSNVHKGWIDINHLGIYVSNSSGRENPTVYLYKNPDCKAEVIDSITNPVWGDMFKVIDCKNGWIQTIYKDKKCWISPNNQVHDNVSPSC